MPHYMRIPPFLVAITVAAFGVLISCALLKQVTLAKSTAPDGLRRLIVNERLHGADASITMTLAIANRNTSIYSDNQDRSPGLVEVYWSEESRHIGVLVCDAYSAEGHILFAYDSELKRAEPIANVIDAIRKSLVTRYGLSPATLDSFHQDAIAWACSQFSGARDRFKKQIGSALELPLTQQK